MSDLRMIHRQKTPSPSPSPYIKEFPKLEGGPLQRDFRLTMFGYTIEAINMLVVPMVKDK